MERPANSRFNFRENAGVLDYAMVLAISGASLPAKPLNAPFVVPSSDADVSRQ
jgi:hypothetical protein